MHNCFKNSFILQKANAVIIAAYATKDEKSSNIDTSTNNCRQPLINIISNHVTLMGHLNARVENVPISNIMDPFRDECNGKM